MTLVSALVFLPSMVQYLEDRDWISFEHNPLRTKTGKKKKKRVAVDQA